MKQLEKMLFALRLEVEASGSQNLKAKMNKDERLSKDVNGKLFTDRK